MREEFISLDILNQFNQFNQALPFADSVVFVPCVPGPLGVCAEYKNK